MSAAESAAARDTGASLALEAEAWKFEIQWAITKAARAFPYFTSDNVRDILAEIGVHELEHPNALGGAFLQASAAGIIESTDQVRRSTRQDANRRKLTVWRSRIFGGGIITSGRIG